MSKRALLSALVMSVLVLGTTGFARAQDEEKTCEDWRCEFQAAITTECPCAEQRNHGSYVSCVAHVVKDLVEAGLPTNCKGKLKRCAARSVCGKEDFVTCNRPEFGICDLATNTCTHDALITCTVDEDCVIGSRCSTKRDAQRCTEAGGTVGESPTCCADCVITPP